MEAQQLEILQASFQESCPTYSNQTEIFEKFFKELVVSTGDVVHKRSDISVLRVNHFNLSRELGIINNQLTERIARLENLKETYA